MLDYIRRSAGVATMLDMRRWVEWCACGPSGRGRQQEQAQPCTLCIAACPTLLNKLYYLSLLILCSLTAACYTAGLRIMTPPS